MSHPAVEKIKANMLMSHQQIESVFGTESQQIQEMSDLLRRDQEILNRILQDKQGKIRFLCVEGRSPIR